MIEIWTCVKCYLIAFWMGMGTCFAKLFYTAYANGITKGEYVESMSIDTLGEMHVEFLVVTFSLFLTVIYFGRLVYRHIEWREHILDVLRDSWEVYDTHDGEGGGLDDEET